MTLLEECQTARPDLEWSGSKNHARAAVGAYELQVSLGLSGKYHARVLNDTYLSRDGDMFCLGDTVADAILRAATKLRCDLSLDSAAEVCGMRLVPTYRCPECGDDADGCYCAEDAEPADGGSPSGQEVSK